MKFALTNLMLGMFMTFSLGSLKNAGEIKPPPSGSQIQIQIPVQSVQIASNNERKKQ